MIKHLLLVVAATATLFTANAAEPVVLWENAAGVTLTNSNGDVNIAPEACSGFTLGGKIEVTIDKQTDAFLKLCYDKPEGGWTDLFQFALGSENPETASVTLLKPQVDIMKNYGFLPFGNNVTIHKIAYVPSDIEVDDNAIWVGPRIFAQDGFDFVDFPADLFSNAKAGDKLVCMISEAQNPYIQLMFGGWEDTFFIKINNYENPERFTITENSITVTLTQEEVDKLKARGLVMPANRFVLNQLLLVPENTIWVGPKSFAQDGFDFVDFPADLFSNAKAGDKLVCKISEAQNPYIQLMFGGWEDTFFIKINNYENPERFTITENSITVTLTQEEVDKLKARGLVMPANRFVLNQLLLVPDNTTGATNLVIDNNDCAVEYYNLQGVRVSNPENGIFIRRQGNKISKIIL